MRNGWLRTLGATVNDIANLLAVVDRDLADARQRSISDDARFSLAYSAALQSAAAALTAAGYRAGRGDSAHFRAIQSLAHTVGVDRPTIDRLDHARQKRNKAVYDVAGMVSRAEADDMIRLATDLKAQVERWLRANYAHLLP